VKQTRELTQNQLLMSRQPGEAWTEICSFFFNQEFPPKRENNRTSQNRSPSHKYLPTNKRHKMKTKELIPTPFEQVQTKQRTNFLK